MAQVLTHADLAALFKGSCKVSILPYNATELAAGSKALAAANFSAADEVYTLKDSLSLSPDDPTTDSIRIDQKNEVIDYSFEEGDWKFDALLPYVAETVLTYLFNSTGGDVTITGKNSVTYKGKGLTDIKPFYAQVLFESEDQSVAIAFGRVHLYANYPAHGNVVTETMNIGLHGDILSNGTYPKFVVPKRVVGSGNGQ